MAISMNKKEVLTRPWTRWFLHVGLSSLQNSEVKMLFQSYSDYCILLEQPEWTRANWTSVWFWIASHSCLGRERGTCKEVISLVLLKYCFDLLITPTIHDFNLLWDPTYFWVLLTVFSLLVPCPQLLNVLVCLPLKCLRDKESMESIRTVVLGRKSITQAAPTIVWFLRPRGLIERPSHKPGSNWPWQVVVVTWSVFLRRDEFGKPGEHNQLLFESVKVWTCPQTSFWVWINTFLLNVNFFTQALNLTSSLFLIPFALKLSFAKTFEPAHFLVGIIVTSL
jgi:hypothetical protein